MSVSPELIVPLGAFLGAFVAGFAGFGLAAAAGAVLLHALPAHQAVPLMMLCSVATQSAGMLWLRRALVLRPAAPLILGGVLGVLVALPVLARTEGALLRDIFGVFLVCYALHALSRSRPLRRLAPWLARSAAPAQIVPPAATALAATDRPATRARARAGGLAGFVGGLTAMPGAVVSVWADAHALPKSETRTLLQPFILVMQLVALTMMLAIPGLLTRELLDLALLAAPGVVAGTALGLVLYGRASAETFRTAVLAIIATSGLGLLTA